MKYLSLFLSLFLFSFLSIQAQHSCTGCGYDGNIIADGSNTFHTPIAADSYYWEICSGNGTISGPINQSSVVVDCVHGNGTYTLGLTAFANGQCITSCNTYRCVMPPPPPPPCCDDIDPDCLMLDLEAGDAHGSFCETIIAVFDASCLPDDCDYTFCDAIWSNSENLTMTNNGALSVTIDLGGNGTYEDEWIQVSVDIVLCDASGNEITCDDAMQWIYVSCGTGSSGSLVGSEPSSGKNTSTNRNLGLKSTVTGGAALYPNPVQSGGVLNLNRDRLPIDEVLTMDIIDLNGKVVQRFSGQQSVLVLDGTYTAGVYYLRVANAETSEVYRFIINK